MNITKFGHCCLLIEVKGLRILTDPGDYSTQQQTASGIDIVLITHEHRDHLHIDSVKAILKNNPSVRIVTNSAVKAILDKEGIKSEVLEDGQTVMIKDVMIEGAGTVHAEIYRDYPRVQNTGYFIDEELFYPGDALYNPKKPVNILALPVAGPWLKISESLDYLVEVHPHVCFPVHDGILARPSMMQRITEMVCQKNSIQFMSLVIDQATEIK